MPLYEYDALTAHGRVVTGTVEADTGDAASAQLTAMDLRVQSLRQAKHAPKGRIGRAEFLLFNQQLASITRSGLPLERGLRQLAADVESPRMKKLLEEIAGELEGGATIDQVMEKRKDSLPPLYSRVIQAGLKSGRLPEMLGSLNRHLEMAGQTRRILLEALTYPTVVLVLAGAVLALLFQGLMPQLDTLFDTIRAQGGDISTDAFAAARGFARIWLGVGVMLVLAVATMVLLSRLPATRAFYEGIMFRLPLVGRIYHLSMLSRLTDAMATLIASGADMPASLRLGAAATGSQVLKLQCEEVAQGIERGKDLLTASEFCTAVPGMFFYSMHHGSLRNEMSDNLLGLSDMCVRQTLAAQAKLQAILPPVVLLAVGSVLGMIIYALFSPIVELTEMMSWF